MLPKGEWSFRWCKQRKAVYSGKNGQRHESKQEEKQISGFLRKGIIFENSQGRRRGLHRRNHGNRLGGRVYFLDDFYYGKHGKYLKACGRGNL